jgi:hypothetical protein
MITLEQAMEWAIEKVEGEPPKVNAQNPDGKWPIEGQVIYGAYGWNRYLIRETEFIKPFCTEVTFSSFHATKEATERARQVGFRIE